MIRFDTDGIAPEHRFEHWRELRARQVMGVTLELPIERRRSFEGKSRAKLFGSVTVASICASAYTVKRTAPDIAGRAAIASVSAIRSTARGTSRHLAMLRKSASAI